MTNPIQAIEIKIDASNETNIIKFYRRGVKTYRRNFNERQYAQAVLDEKLECLIRDGVFEVRNNLLYEGKIMFLRKVGK